MRTSRALKIIEIGPGTGVLAESILEFAKNYDTRKIEYHLVEISSTLCDHLESRFKDHPNVQIHNTSILDFKQKSDDPFYVVGMEILDNMPHDRIYKDTQKPDEQWKYQTLVYQNKDGELEEQLEPITDPW